MPLDLVKTERLVRRLADHLREKTPASSLYGLAEDYAKCVSEVNRRLTQCVEMIAAGKTYDALKHATTVPDVLELAAALSDPSIDGWRDFCKAESLTVSELLDEAAVQKVNPLYEKVGGLMDKLRGDYRDANFRRDTDDCLKILRSIVKANPADEKEKENLAQMESSLIHEEIERLKAYVSALNDDAILRSLNRLDVLGSGRDPSGEVWMRALERKAELEAAQALVDVGTLLAESREHVAAGRDEDAFQAVAHMQSLVGEHGLRLDADSSGKLADLVEWITEKRRKARSDADLAEALHNLREQMQRAGDHLFRAGSTPSAVFVDDRDALRKTYKHLTDLGRAVPNEVMEELKQVNTRLVSILDGRKKARMRNRILATAAAVVICMAATWYGYRYWNASQITIELARLQQSRQAKALEELTARLNGSDASLVSSFVGLASQKQVADAWLAAERAKLSQTGEAVAGLEREVAASFRDTDPATFQASFGKARQMTDALPEDFKPDPDSRLLKVDLEWRQALAGIRQKRAEQFRAELTALETDADERLAYSKGPGAVIPVLAEMKPRLDALAQRAHTPVKDLELAPAETSRLEILKERIAKIAQAASGYESLVQAAMNARDFASWRTAHMAYQNSVFVQGDLRTAWSRVADALTTEPDFLRLLMMPDNPDLWRRFVSNPLAGKGMPDDVQAGEKRIFLSLREDQNLRGIYVHELQGRTIYSQNVLDVREAKVGDMTVVAAKGRVYLPHLSPMEARFEDRIDTPFKETRSGGGASGAVPKNGRLSPECDFAIQLGLEAGVNDVVSTYRENFLRYVDRVVAAPDINPLFKAYLHYKLGELLRFRPEAWGLGWTDFEHDHESLGAAGAAKLASGDWMVPRKVEQMSKPIVEYYQKLGETRYHALAVVLPVLYDRLFTGGFAYAGCVRPDGTIHLERPGADKRVWGLNAQMRVASFQADDPKAPVHPYSPLYREKLNLRDLLQSTCTKYGVQPDDAPFASKLPVFLR